MRMDRFRSITALVMAAALALLIAACTPTSSPGVDVPETSPEVSVPASPAGS